MNSYLEKLEKIKKKRKIVGRGISAGQGKSCGRGQKGQGARKSGSVRVGFEGGQTEFIHRIPKWGQVGSKHWKRDVTIINLREIQSDDKIIDNQTLDFTSKFTKVLGDLGDSNIFNKKLTIIAAGFSADAKKIESTNGEWRIG